MRERIGTRNTFGKVSQKVSFLLDNPSRKWYHSMQNLILHITQPSREPTQVQKRIRTKKSWNMVLTLPMYYRYVFQSLIIQIGSILLKEIFF
jgi:hypothetical protein